MNKVSIIALFCGLVAGAIGGFEGGRRSHEQTVESSLPEKIKPSPRFGDWERNSLSGKKNRSLYNSGMEQFVGQCANMTGKQLAEALQDGLQTLRTGKSPGSATIPMLHYLAYNAGAEVPQDTLAVILDAGPRFRDLCTTTLQGWASRSPEMAADFIISRQKEYPQFLPLLREIGEQMTKDSPEKALNWLSSLPKSIHPLILSGILDTVAEFHSDQISMILQGLKPEDLTPASSIPNSHPTDKIVKTWAVADWNAAEAWIKTMPENLQKIMFTSAFQVLAEKDPALAAKALAQMEGTLKTNLTLVVLTGISRTSPAKALDWLSQNISKEENLPFLSMVTIMSGPVTPDLKEKILNLPDGPIRDGALEALSMHYSSHISPETTLNDLLSPASLISDKDTREKHLRANLRAWMKQNPEETRQWILEKSDFSAEWKQKLVQECDEAASKSSPEVKFHPVFSPQLP